MKVEADRFERTKMWTNGRADSSHIGEICRREDQK